VERAFPIRLLVDRGDRIDDLALRDHARLHRNPVGGEYLLTRHGDDARPHVDPGDRACRRPQTIASRLDDRLNRP
jgi:hypothetical protein